jgi:hypothetical protein
MNVRGSFHHKEYGKFTLLKKLTRMVAATENPDMDTNCCELNRIS